MKKNLFMLMVILCAAYGGKATPEKKLLCANLTDLPGSDDSGNVKVYNNYDFVPGQTVLFEDNFRSDEDGEFPAHWKLDKGQAVMNVVNGVNSILLTEGNFVQVYPRMKTPAYLTDPFTLELDYLVSKSGGYGLVFIMKNPEKNIVIHVREDGTCEDEHLSSPYPGDHSPEAYRNKWHHVAISFKNGQIKIYVDQYRVLVDPDFGMTPTSFMVCSAPDPGKPTIFTNFRLASGAGMKMVGKKFTDSKIVTHGINFDYDKATLRPESMGTLNMIAKVMNDNPEIKFEVGGHTDGDGDAAYNLKLSQQRADAVRRQLVTMGIDSSRLTAKGYGKTKPIADNTTDDGKANNRRVEFVKK